MQRILRAVTAPQRLGELLSCRKATPGWKQVTAAYIGLPFRPFSITLGSGIFEFREKSDVATFWQVFFGKLYPLRASDRLLIDAGANIGVFSVYALLSLPQCRVISIEPSGSTFDRLQAALRANGVEQRCTSIHAAIGSSEGITTIATGGASQFRRSGREGEPVRMTTLAAVIPQEGRVDLLKMDAEGAEYDALGSTSRGVLDRIGRIALEFHPTEGGPHRWPALKKHLTASGFRLISELENGGGYGMAYLER